MKTLSITLLLMMLATPAHAGEWFSWDKTNTQLHVPLTLLMIADLGQTLDIADKCASRIVVRFDGSTNYDSSGNYYYHPHVEGNSYLGQCPTRTHAKQYFGWMLTAITTAVWASPPKMSYAIQGGVISVQLYIVGGNYYAGVGWGF